MNKIYISGKITGMEEEAFILFEKVEKELVGLGFDVVNPMKLPHNHDKSWESYMKECLEAMDDCSIIYLLHNWHRSKGAKVEIKKALEEDFEIITQY